jgi:fructan beta-fructosidase
MDRTRWRSWNVSGLEGRTACIEILDDASGRWGHINVDHIVQSARRWEAMPVQRVFTITQRHLWLPVKNGAPQRRMQFRVGGKVVREFTIEYATGERDFEVFADVSAFHGQQLTVQTKLPGGSPALIPASPA